MDWIISFISKFSSSSFFWPQRDAMQHILTTHWVLLIVKRVYLHFARHALGKYREKGTTSEQVLQIQNAILSAEKKESDQREAERKKCDDSGTYLSKNWLPPCKKRLGERIYDFGISRVVNCALISLDFNTTAESEDSNVTDESNDEHEKSDRIEE